MGGRRLFALRVSRLEIRWFGPVYRTTGRREALRAKDSDPKLPDERISRIDLRLFWRRQTTTAATLFSLRSGGYCRHVADSALALQFLPPLGECWRRGAPALHPSGQLFLGGCSERDPHGDLKSGNLLGAGDARYVSGRREANLQL